MSTSGLRDVPRDVLAALAVLENGLMPRHEGAGQQANGNP
jgi:hypothetical protein